MLYLLQDVRLAVRPVNLHDAALFVDRRVVVIHMEIFVGERQPLNGVGLGFDAEVEVPELT